MTKNNFVEALERFVSHAKPSEESPVQLIMKNHASHFNLRDIKFPRQNLLKILSFPPDSVTGYSLLMLRFTDHLKRENPGKTITIHQVALFARNAYLAGLNMVNVTLGFIKTGIYPLNYYYYYNYVDIF